MTDDTAVAAPPPDPGAPTRARMSVGDKVRLLLRGIGQTLITLGVVVMLFIVYEVWVSNWASERANRRLVRTLETQWTKQRQAPLPDSGPLVVPVGDAIGILYIPRLGRDFAWAIVEGDRTPNQDQLSDGPAHYGGTAMPGECPTIPAPCRPRS